MDGVKRYSIFMHRRGGNKSVEMVEGEHFDAALAREAALQRDHDNWKLKACEAAEREAALREELKARELDVKAHAGRRVAAEQRNTKLLHVLGRFRNAFVIAVGDKSPFAKCALEEVDAALKPTESGASE